MSEDMKDFDAALGKMGRGIRQTRAAFNDADNGFIEALEALKTITEKRGSLDDRFTEMRETISHMEQMILDQGKQINDQTAQLKDQTKQINELRGHFGDLK